MLVKITFGEIEIPCIVMFDEFVGFTKEGVELLIDTYFKDLIYEQIPKEYYFEEGENKGCFFDAINFLYCSSKTKNKSRFKQLLAESLPSFIDPQNGLIQKQPELNLAERNKFDSFLKSLKK